MKTIILLLFIVTFAAITCFISCKKEKLPLPQPGDNNQPLVNAQLILFDILSQARREITVASAGNKIVFAGGRSYNYDNSSRVDIYDIGAQTWSTAELSVARRRIAAVASGNKIFFGGGEIGDGTTPVKTVDIYDISTNAWSTTELSEPRNEIAAAAVGDKVLFAGGDPGLEGDTCLAWQCRVVDIYNISSQTWSVASLSEHKQSFSAITVNDKVYFAGGQTWISVPNNSYGIHFASEKIDIYDNSSNTWDTSSLHEGKFAYAGISVDNKIYWAGGYTKNLTTSSHKSSVVEIRDVITGSSSIQYLSKPQEWWIDYGQHAVVKDNKIIFFSPNGTTDRNKFDIYDIATNSWSIGLLPQPIPLRASIISVNNTIYIAGGSVNGVLSNQVWKLEF